MLQLQGLHLRHLSSNCIAQRAAKGDIHTGEHSQQEGLPPADARILHPVQYRPVQYWAQPYNMHVRVCRPACYQHTMQHTAACSQLSVGALTRCYVYVVCWKN